MADWELSHICDVLRNDIEATKVLSDVNPSDSHIDEFQMKANISARLVRKIEPHLEDDDDRRLPERPELN